MHQRNSMAEEKRLIKDLKFAEETRANIISANGIEKTWCFPEDIKKRIKVRLGHSSDVFDHFSFDVGFQATKLCKNFNNWFNGIFHCCRISKLRYYSKEWS